MSEKKGLFASLFGGNKSGGCCNMEIVEEKAECCCGSAEAQETYASESEQADIQILGPGCKNCQTLEVNVKEASENTSK